MHLDPYRFCSCCRRPHHVLSSFPFWAKLRAWDEKMCIIETRCAITGKRHGRREERRKGWIKEV